MTAQINSNCEYKQQTPYVSPYKDVFRDQSILVLIQEIAKFSMSKDNDEFYDKAILPLLKGWGYGAAGGAAVGGMVSMTTGARAIATISNGATYGSAVGLTVGCIIAAVQSCKQYQEIAWLRKNGELIQRFKEVHEGDNTFRNFVCPFKFDLIVGRAVKVKDDTHERWYDKEMYTAYIQGLKNDGKHSLDPFTKKLVTTDSLIDATYEYKMKLSIFYTKTLENDAARETDPNIKEKLRQNISEMTTKISQEFKRKVDKLTQKRKEQKITLAQFKEKLRIIINIFDFKKTQ